MPEDSSLDVFKTNNLGLLLRLAQKLFDDGFFNCYMSPQLFNLLSFVLTRYEQETRDKVWKALMESNLAVNIERYEVGPSRHVSRRSSGDSNGAKTDTDGDSAMKADVGKNDTGKTSPEDDEDLYLKPGFSSARNLCSILRYLLYEKAVDYFYTDDEHKAKSKTLKEFEIFGEEDKPATDGSTETAEPAKEGKKEDKVRGEESDYDDDDDDDDDDGDDNNEGQEQKQEGNADDEDHFDDAKEEVALEKVKEEHEADIAKKVATGSAGELVIAVPYEYITAKPRYPAPHEGFSSNDEAIDKMMHPILSTSSAIESNLEKQNELKLIKNFNKVYHGFENDLPNIVKRRRLEKSDKQLGLKDNEPDETEERNVNKLMNLGGAVNLSLKNLLGRIDDNRDKLNMTDIELKNLIMDVRKNRSKWANYNRIGQEELYEACEKVVTELRGYTEHSTPFLNRVSKREAPNYYDIIKTPMDLNTVMRKLRTFQYNSKKEFLDDLNLIWQNCLTYNADPKHYMRIDAHAMQKKTNALAPLIPDITIRDRAEVEREAKEQEAKEKEQEDSKEKSKSTRGLTEKKLKKGTHEGTPATEADAKDEADGAAVSAAAAAAVDTATVPTTEGPSEPSEKHEDASSSAAPEQDVSEKPSEMDVDGEEGADADEDAAAAAANASGNGTSHPDDDDVGEDLETATWKSLTSNTRFKLCEARSNMFKDNKIQMNSESLYRDSLQMSNFMSYLDDDSSVVLHKNRRYFDENDDPYLIEYDISGGVPPIEHKNVDLEAEENEILEKLLADGKTLDTLPESGMKIKDNGSNKVILENISLMQDVRRVCFRINLIRQMQTAQFMHRSQLQPPNIERLEVSDIENMSKLPTRDLLTPNIAYRALQKSVGIIIMSNGFESSSPLCASMITQIAENYMGNLAKTLKLHLESNSINKMLIKGDSPVSLKDVLQMTLFENGIEKPDVLYTYYKEVLYKKNRKLKDLRESLEAFLRDLLRPGLQDISETQFNDDSEQFVSGEFSDEIGEDFFGFKELGLDREFGMLTSSVPLHLLHSRLSQQYSNMNKNTSKAKFDDFKEVQFPKMYKRDLPKQIGLLQHYYKQLLEKSKAHYAKQLKKQQQLAAAGNTVDMDPTFHEINEEEDMMMIEDEDLPVKQRNNRPKVPPSGRIVQVKKKFVGSTFFIDDQDKWVAEEKDAVSSL